MVVVFSDDCETGSISDNWNNVSTAAYTTTQANSGTKSIEQSGSSFNFTIDSGTITQPTSVIWYFYDDNNETTNFQSRVSVSHSAGFGMGVHNGMSLTKYQYITPATWNNDTGVTRAVGWHKFELRQDGANVDYYIDDTEVATYAGTLGTQIDMNFYTTAERGYFYDDITADDGTTAPMIDMGGLYVYMILGIL